MAQFHSRCQHHNSRKVLDLVGQREVFTAHNTRHKRAWGEALGEGGCGNPTMQLSYSLATLPSTISAPSSTTTALAL